MAFTTKRRRTKPNHDTMHCRYTALLASPNLNWSPPCRHESTRHPSYSCGATGIPCWHVPSRSTIVSIYSRCPSVEEPVI